MKSKRKLLKESRLYAIIDKKICGSKPLLTIARQAQYCGADIIQYRDKTSKKEEILSNCFFLHRYLKNSGVIFIINDYLDVAKILDCDGIHLGQADTSIETARRILGADKIIGISCHNERQALCAQDRGADYIGIGPIFPTPLKPEYQALGLDIIKELSKRLTIPFFAIGNINQDNIDKVLGAGAKRVAVCRAIFQAKNIMG